MLPGSKPHKRFFLSCTSLLGIRYVDRHKLFFYVLAYLTITLYKAQVVCAKTILRYSFRTDISYMFRLNLFPVLLNMFFLSCPLFRLIGVNKIKKTQKYQ